MAEQLIRKSDAKERGESEPAKSEPPKDEERTLDDIIEAYARR